MKTRRGNSQQRKAGRSPREAIPLKEYFSKSLAAYAATAAAAGVGLLATAQPASADIEYTPANITLLGGQTLSLDINQDGTNDFRFVNRYGPYSKSLRVYGSTAGDKIMGTGSFGSASVLPRGASIGPSGKFRPGACMAFTYVGSVFCHWLNVTNKFLGLEFQVSGQEYFGWAEFSVGPPGITATLEGYAYETVAGKSILAGQTSETPEPGTLGLLALGSLGLGFWRRKQQPVTSDK